jgi:hypothetical protein
VTRGLVLALVLALAGPAVARPATKQAGKAPAPKAAAARKPAATGNHGNGKERATASSSSSSETAGSSDSGGGDDNTTTTTTTTTAGGGKVKSKAYSFGAMDVEGKLKTPQLLYFLNRVKLELDMSAPDKRSFMKELQQSADDKNL